MCSIPKAVAAIKSAVTDSIPAQVIERLCRQLGHRWRKRELDPVVTVHLFLQQVLHGNASIAHLRRLSKVEFNPSAYCQARIRLPLPLFQRLQRAVADTLESDGDGPDTRWLGHRVFILDGSSFSMPDTEELRNYFGQPTGQAEGCGFPVAHLMALCDAKRGYLLEATAQPLFTSDLSQVAGIHARLEPGDVLVGDRIFGTYAHLAMCHKQHIHGLFRAHQQTIVDFRPGRPHNAPGHTPVKGRPRSRWLKRLGPQDQLVEYYKPEECPEWMTPQQYATLPESILVRELRYRVNCPGYRTREVTLVTTLLDPKEYPAEELAQLYGLRWQVEVNLRHLKETMKMDVLRCETVEGVQKELAMFAVIYNLVRRVMEVAGRRQGVEANRISFVDAWRWLQQARPGEALPELVVNPYRPGRVQPRVKKRRPKKYKLMTRPRAELLKALLQQQPAA
jgi:Transposase DDE domain